MNLCERPLRDLLIGKIQVATEKKVQFHDSQSRETAAEQLDAVNRLLKAIILRGRKCKLIVSFNGRRLTCDYVMPGIKEEEL